ncbi:MULTISPECIES: GT-D fold domain-containing glycosyltransferase [Paenibacillus]|uniref:GT-D fold domain-containing protein n=1 Tax=Paenibacillus TaxID=44249 RepID=UPI001F18DE2E|nr:MULTISPECIES: GT-D fold domain-containing glycosyltransferase [Paenibacillus]
MLEQAAASFNEGFDTGYDEAMMRSQQHSVPETKVKPSSGEGYAKGLYDGGEGIVDSILPELEVLPEISVRQIIEEGMKQLSSQYYRLMSAAEVAGRIKEALDSSSPLSVIRLGDGELLTLAQEMVLNEDEVRKEGHFLSYAGVSLPDLIARDLLAASVRNADIVGIPKLRLPNFQPLCFSVLKAHGIDYRKLQLTLSTVNYALHLEGLLPGILAGRRVLVVGNSAPGLSRVLSDRGIKVTGTVAPVEGMHDIPRTMDEIRGHPFDIALVGAGIPAVIITERIASELGKVAIDFGHLADSLTNGESTL